MYYSALAHVVDENAEFSLGTVLVLVAAWDTSCQQKTFKSFHFESC